MLRLFEFAEQRITRTSRSRRFLAVLLAFSAIGVLNHPKSVLSQSNDLMALNPGDLVCYMQTIEGQVINLNKLCGDGKGRVSTLSSLDQRFLDRYQLLLSKRAANLPSVQAALLQAQQNPQAVLQRAQAICTALRTGQPQTQTLGQVGDDLFATMAPKYYCPDLDD